MLGKDRLTVFNDDWHNVTTAKNLKRMLAEIISGTNLRGPFTRIYKGGHSHDICDYEFKKRVAWHALIVDILSSLLFLKVILIINLCLNAAKNQSTVLL
jgi:hypothetical protein